MDNNSRSERTRNLVIQSALAIITRDGPNRLTLDAIAKEAGISKGGVMHQFPTKEAVLRALLDYQGEHFGEFISRFLDQHGAEYGQPQLASQIATAQEAIAGQRSVAMAVLAVIAREPDLLNGPKSKDAVTIEQIRKEASDPDLAVLRLYAARGLMHSAMLGLCPLSDDERQKLFARLLDDSRWTGCADH